MNTTLKVLFAGLAVVAMSACGGPNFNGIYSGSCTGSPCNGTVNMTLYQQGNNVTGYWETSTIGGSFSATVSDSTLTSCTFTQAGGTATTAGTLTLSNQNLSGACGTANVNLNQTR